MRCCFVTLKGIWNLTVSAFGPMPAFRPMTAALVWGKRLSRLSIKGERGMHELSIAIGILEAAEEESENRGGVRVDAIHLRWGH